MRVFKADQNTAFTLILFCDIFFCLFLQKPNKNYLILITIGNFRVHHAFCLMAGNQKCEYEIHCNSHANSIKNHTERDLMASWSIHTN